MPFDNHSNIPLTEDLFQARREKACQLWEKVPNPLFDMRQWECGSRACALGWLSSEEMDGWHWADGDVPDWEGRAGRRSAYVAAAEYFGLTVAQSIGCFAGDAESARVHGRWFPRRITAADVGKTLRALPITIPA